MTPDERAGARAVPLTRIGTGSPELDGILEGGFPANSINVLMGGPGTGKTVLAQQLVFHNATEDRIAVYVTTLSEPQSKVVKYLQRFEFYDEAKLFGSVVYEDVGPELLEHGVDHLLVRVKELIHDLGPAVLVIDSFKALHDLAESPVDMRRVAAELGGLLSAYDVTAFLVGEYAPDAAALYPEFAVADGIVELTRLGSTKRDERYLRVRKLRGSGYHEGLHAFDLGPRGLSVYPRLVTPDTPPDYRARLERVSTGIEGLDTMLGGGLWRGSSTLVVGAGGTGKTTFGLGFAVAGARSGEPSLYLNFQENPTQLSRTIHGLGIQLEEARTSGLELMYRSPVELAIDAVVVDLFRAMEEQGTRRVVIDSLGEVAVAASSMERFHDYVYSVVQLCAVQGITTVLTLEGPTAVASAPHRHDARYSTLSDALIELSVDMSGDPPVRRLQVVKARGIHHTLRAVPMTIEKGGIVIESEDARGSG